MPPTAREHVAPFARQHALAHVSRATRSQAHSRLGIGIGGVVGARAATAVGGSWRRRLIERRDRVFTFLGS